VLALIKQLSIEPFQSLLAKLLRCEPTEVAIQAHANKYPDKHLQALTMAARLAGYHKDAPAVQNNMFVVIQGIWLHDWLAITKMHQPYRTTCLW